MAYTKVRKPEKQKGQYDKKFTNPQIQDKLYKKKKS